jgi:hypothetical protein
MSAVVSYKDCLARAERITWRVEDLIGPDRPLDFSRPFLPEALARIEDLDFLTAPERLALNQIRGNAYLSLFALVETFILPFLIDHARPSVSGESFRARALLEFAAEEAKHIHLFRTFSEAFAYGFPTHCDVIGPAETVADHVLAHPPLAVSLLVLHLEWMSQRHFTESMRDEDRMDARFKDLLLHHWREEQQHAQMDTLVVRELAVRCSPGEIDVALQGYKDLVAFLDAGLADQVAFDLEALERATGCRLDPAQRERFVAVQQRANRWTYLGSGMSHPDFVDTVRRLKPSAVAEFAALADTLS